MAEQTISLETDSNKENAPEQVASKPVETKPKPVETKATEQKQPIESKSKPVEVKVPEQKVETKEKLVEAKVPEQKPEVSPKPVEAKAKPEVSEQKSDSYKHIVRIANVDLPGDKLIKIALRKIKGVGFNLASAACNLAKVSQLKKTGDLTDEEIKKLTDILNNPDKNGLPVWMFNKRKEFETGEDKHLLIGNLDYSNDNTIKRLRKIKCYQGVRHSARLPVRGQRTKSNFRRSKGKVVGVSKKKGVKAGRP